MPILPINHIDTKPESETPRIAGTRFTVPIVVATILNNPEMTPQKYAEAFDLTLGQVYAALSYYYDHQAEIEAIWKEGDHLAEEIGTSSTELQQRFEARLKARQEPQKP